MSSPLEKWVAETENKTRPKRVVWCDGSDAQQQEFFDTMVREDHTFALNPKTFPGSYLHRSNPNDVARTEHLTFICTRKKEAAGPTNHLDGARRSKRKNRHAF